MSSLAYLWFWSPPLHTPYISSPSHYPPFVKHVHTIVTCFAVVRDHVHYSYSLSVNSFFETLSFNLTPRIHLIILISWAIVWHCLCVPVFAILVELRLVTDRHTQTYTQTQCHSIYHARHRSCGKSPELLLFWYSVYLGCPGKKSVKRVL